MTCPLGGTKTKESECEACSSRHEGGTMSVQFASRKAIVLRALVLAFVLSVPSATPAAAIQGGTSVSKSAAPWLVAVLSREPNGDEYKCSGSVIASRWILTAAHCVTDGADNSALSPSAIRVLAPGVSPDIAGAWERGVAPLDVYPNGLYTYYSDGFYPWADIALIELEQRLPGTKLIKLDSPTAVNPIGTPVRAYGWGVTTNRGTDAGSLARSVPLKLLSGSGDDTCRKWTVQNGWQGPALICAGSTSQSVGICSGDSGGPLVRPGRIPTQVGITSFSTAESYCSTYRRPGQFVRISSMRWWIDSIVGSDDLVASTEGTSTWPYYTSANYLRDALAVGPTGNIMILAGDDSDGGLQDSWAERVYGDVARQDLTFASAYDGIDSFAFNEIIRDATLLSDGRPIWASTTEDGTSTVPMLYVTRADGSGTTYETWESGSGLAQKFLGSDYVNGWNISFPALASTASGGVIGVFEVWQGEFGSSDHIIAEWTSNGVLANTFGGDGWVRIGRPGVNESQYQTHLMADGRIAILGRYESSCAVWMVKRDGNLDTNWDGDGLRTFGSRGCIARGTVEDGSGGLFVVGADRAQNNTSNSSAFITHLNSTGGTDSSFGRSGYVWVKTAGVDYLMDVCKTPEGVLVAAGQSSASARYNFLSGVGSLGLITVVSTTGKPTSTFGTKTYREFALGGQNDYFVSTECMSDGSVVIGGQSVLALSDGTDDIWSLVLKVNVKP